MENSLCVWPVKIAQLVLVMRSWFMETHKGKIITESHGETDDLKALELKALVDRLA